MSTPIGSHANENKNDRKNLINFFLKSQMQFCEGRWEDNIGDVWYISAGICRRNSLLEIVFSEKSQVHRMTPKWSAIDLKPSSFVVHPPPGLVGGPPPPPPASTSRCLGFSWPVPVYWYVGGGDCRLSHAISKHCKCKYYFRKRKSHIPYIYVSGRSSSCWNFSGFQIAAAEPKRNNIHVNVIVASSNCR